MHRQIGRVIDQQSSWAKPLGEGAQELLKEVFEGTWPLKDLLNGRWLGHPLHPVVTDVPVGAMTVAAIQSGGARKSPKYPAASCWPRVQIRTEPSSTTASTRNPSHLTSNSQSGPSNGAATSVASIGGTNAGRVRGVRAVTAAA